MKRIISVLLLAIMIFSASCSSGDTTATDSYGEQSSKTESFFILVRYLKEHSRVRLRQPKAMTAVKPGKNFIHLTTLKTILTFRHTSRMQLSLTTAQFLALSVFMKILMLISFVCTKHFQATAVRPGLHLNIFVRAHLPT